RAVPDLQSDGFLFWTTIPHRAKSGLTNTFCPGNGVPEGGVGAAAPDAEGGDALVEHLPVEQSLGQDGFPGPVQDLDEVRHVATKRRVARTAPEEQPGVADWLGPRCVQQFDQASADERIVAEAVVGTNVSVPDWAQPGRLRPKTQQVVIVVGQDDAATGPDR